MATISTQRVRRLLAQSDVATTNVRRGQILEELLSYIFGRCAGVRHYANDAINAAGSSELDVCFWNNKNASELPFLPEILVVECKNTRRRVGSPAVRVFLSKLNDMGLDHGILVAAHGITGNPNSLRAAHDIIRTAFHAHRIRLIVITRTELRSVTETDDLVLLLQDKLLLLTMQARTFEG